MATCYSAHVGKPTGATRVTAWCGDRGAGSLGCSDDRGACALCLGPTVARMSHFHPRDERVGCAWVCRRSPQITRLSASNEQTRSALQAQIGAHASKWDRVLDTLESIKSARLEAAAQAQAAAVAAQAAAAAAAAVPTPGVAGGRQLRGARVVAGRVGTRVTRPPPRTRHIRPLQPTLPTHREGMSDDADDALMDDGAGGSGAAARTSSGRRVGPDAAAGTWGASRSGDGPPSRTAQPATSSMKQRGLTRDDWEDARDAARPNSAAGSQGRLSPSSSVTRSALGTITDASDSEMTTTDGSYLSDSDEDDRTVDSASVRGGASPAGWNSSTTGRRGRSGSVISDKRSPRARRSDGTPRSVTFQDGQPARSRPPVAMVPRPPMGARAMGAVRSPSPVTPLTVDTHQQPSQKGAGAGSSAGQGADAGAGARVGGAAAAAAAGPDDSAGRSASADAGAGHAGKSAAADATSPESKPAHPPAPSFTLPPSTGTPPAAGKKGMSSNSSVHSLTLTGAQGWGTPNVRYSKGTHTRFSSVVCYAPCSHRCCVTAP